MICIVFTWLSNKNGETRLVEVQRKHSMRVSNVQYAKRVRNEALFSLVNCALLPQEVRKLRKTSEARPRKGSDFKNNLGYTKNLPERSFRRRHPGILKTYCKDFIQHTRLAEGKNFGP